jgi:hypothetical protein
VRDADMIQQKMKLYAYLRRRNPRLGIRRGNSFLEINPILVEGEH